MGTPPSCTAFSHHSVECTAYSSDWRSCGWEWGVALGPFPVYVPLCLGHRPSGSVAWPFVPKRNRDVSAPHKNDLLLGALCLGAVCGAGAVFNAACGGELMSKGLAKSLRLDKLWRNNQSSILKSAAVGASLGGTVFPIRRFWAETNLVGLRYQGPTCTGAFPKQSRPAITRHNPLRDPVGFIVRLVTFKWAPQLGTIAADTNVFPLKSKMHVDGYGWGMVEDRGGAIKGNDRLDLYFDSRKDALKFGRRRVDVQVENL